MENKEGIDGVQYLLYYKDGQHFGSRCIKNVNVLFNVAEQTETILNAHELFEVFPVSKPTAHIPTHVMQYWDEKTYNCAKQLYTNK
jgi:hypothetical protein